MTAITPTIDVRQRWLDWRFPVAAFVVWIALVGAFEFNKPVDYAGPGLCMMRNVTGLPCPTCGGTRAAMAVGRGDFLVALTHNPLLVLGGGLFVLWIGARLVLGEPFTHRSSRTLRTCVWIGAVALVLANWAYLIAREQLLL